MPLPHRFWSADLSLSILLLSLSLAVFVIQPLGYLGLGGRLLIAVFFSFVLISGVATVAKNRRVTGVAGTLLLTTLGVRWVRVWRGGASLMVPDTLFSSLFCIVLAAAVMAQVFRAGPITFQRIQGAIAVYLLIGLAFAFGYEFIALRWPNAFLVVQGANASGDLTPHFVYFSFITLTTVGFGDVTAVHPVARSLVTLEALTGQLFPSILLARLVSMELYYRHTMDAERR